MQILNIFHVLIAIALVGFVLIQKGQGATAGAAFGSGASGTVFGARGAGNFLSKTTWVLAGLFCALSLTIAVLVSRSVDLPEANLGVVESATVVPRSAAEAPDAESLDSGANEAVESDVPMLETEALDPETFSTEGASKAIEDDIPDLPSIDESVPSAEGETVEGTDSGPGTDSGGI